ncbi:hypothetical protein [Acinetobacter baumannii]|uniref:hypothetical protein n=1 Tax=Acinetobacter baumannii TaxID=470 RepID=UPI003F1BE12C
MQQSLSQYKSVAGVSKATSTRHLTELLEWDVLHKLEGGGRNTRYVLKIDKEQFSQTCSDVLKNVIAEQLGTGLCVDHRLPARPTIEPYRVCRRLFYLS